MTREEMEQLTAGTDNKSEKIRTLYRHDVPRAEIARFLDITYQHVQNVLKRGGLVGKAAAAEQSASTEQVYTVPVGPKGQITLPPEYVERIGIREGELLICREDDGGLTIMSREAAKAAMVELVRKRMPAEAALFEALMADRTT